MGEVATHAHALLIGLPRRARRARMLVAERELAVHEVADRLDPTPAGGRIAEELPRDRGQAVGFAVAAAEQKDERVVGQQLDRRLPRLGGDDVVDAVDQRVRGDARLAGRSHDAAAPVAEGVAVGRHRKGRLGHDPVRNDDVGCVREVDVQHQDHRCRLRTVVHQLVAYADLHGPAPVRRRRNPRITAPPPVGAGTRPGRPRSTPC